MKQDKEHAQKWNEKIDTVCYKHRIYPKLNKHNEYYTFPNPVWIWLRKNLNM